MSEPTENEEANDILMVTMWLEKNGDSSLAVVLPDECTEDDCVSYGTRIASLCSGEYTDAIIESLKEGGVIKNSEGLVAIISATLITELERLALSRDEGSDEDVVSIMEEFE